MQKGKATASPPAMVFQGRPPQQNSRGPPSSQQRPDDFTPRQPQAFQLPAQMPQNIVMGQMPGQMQRPQGQPRLGNQQQVYHGQTPMRIPRHQGPNNPQMYATPAGGLVTAQMVEPLLPLFIPPSWPNPQLIAQYVENTQIPVGGPPQMQYRPQQAMHGQFTPVSGPSQPHGPYGYPQTIVYPMEQPSSPVYIVRAPTAPTTGMPQFQTQNFDPRAREKKIIQIKDPNSNKDVTQEILNRQPLGSLTVYSSPDISERFGSSRKLRSQQRGVPKLRVARADKRRVVTIVDNLHEDAAEPLTIITEEVDQQVAEPESTAEASEAEVLPVTSELEDAVGVEKVNGHEGDTEVSAVTKNPIDTHTAVPPEIVVRGRLALEAYNKALAEGKTFDKRVPVMLIGQDRSGKTSLKKSLRGEPFNPNEESTVGIDVDPSHFQVSTEIWKAGEKDQETSSKTSISYEYHAARVTVENLKQEKSVLGEEIPMGTTVLANKDFISVSPASYNPVSDVSSTSSQDLRSHGTSSMDSELGSSISHIPKDIENEMLKRMQNDHKMEDEEGIYSVLWDFAGQLVYYTTHPLFLTPRAIYLLINDLSQNPSETAKPVVKQGVYKKFEDIFGMNTNLDYLDFWLFSIASLASQKEVELVGSNSEVLPEKLPPVFLVCTHADSPYDGGDPSTLADELFGSLQTKPYKMHLHDVFVVDNTKSGLESECPEVVRLREEVLAIAKELPQMKEAIPIRWLKYEKELAARKEGHKWISLETATKIASECKVVDNREFKTLLNFLHDKKILIHFDDTPELNELVVLDPQWLIDVFKKVITVKPYDRKGKKFTELWSKLEHKGILDEKLLEQVWGPLFDDRATCERLLQIMEKFSLLCPWSSFDASCGKQYLVPSMLTTYPPKKIMKLVEVASAQIPPLFLKFESGQVPPGLFPRLVLRFLQWGKENCLNPVKPFLYHNFARCFISEEISQSVILLCRSSSIKVVVHRENQSGADVSPNNLDGTIAGSVFRQLGLMLESMREEFFWLKNMRYQLSFICPVCCEGDAVECCDTHHEQGCRQEECLDFRSASEFCNAKFISCTKSATSLNGRVSTDLFEAWFTTPGKQNIAQKKKGGDDDEGGRVTEKRKREVTSDSSSKRFRGPVTSKLLKVKGGIPEDEVLQSLADQISKDWRRLGRLLLGSKFEAALDDIDEQYKSYYEKIYQMLLKWKRTKGSGALFRDLYDALCDDLVCRRDLAEEFCCVRQ